MESFIFTVVWFTVQEGEVIDGDVSVKIIPDGSFYHDLTKRRGEQERGVFKLHDIHCILSNLDFGFKGRTCRTQ